MVSINAKTICVFPQIAYFKRISWKGDWNLKVSLNLSLVSGKQKDLAHKNSHQILCSNNISPRRPHPVPTARVGWRRAGARSEWDVGNSLNSCTKGDQGCIACQMSFVRIAGVITSKGLSHSERYCSAVLEFDSGLIQVSAVANFPSCHTCVVNVTHTDKFSWFGWHNVGPSLWRKTADWPRCAGPWRPLLLRISLQDFMFHGTRTRNDYYVLMCNHGGILHLWKCGV